MRPTAPDRLVIATGNAHKLDEYRALLPGLPLVGLAGFPPAPEPVEDAPDFVGNALIKARAGAARTGWPTLADDSGIGVAALGWAPGVRSARYAPGTDRDRLEALLAATADADDRRARFTCAIAVAGLPAGALAGPLPTGVERRGDCLVAVGLVEGRLTRGPRGEGGFGYDAIFALPDGRTAAEVPPGEKHAVSHRGRASRVIAPVLRRIFLVDEAGTHV